jgi:hypothetical protein
MKPNSRGSQYGGHQPSPLVEVNGAVLDHRVDRTLFSPERITEEFHSDVAGKAGFSERATVPRD